MSIWFVFIGSSQQGFKIIDRVEAPANLTAHEVREDLLKRNVYPTSIQLCPRFDRARGFTKSMRIDTNGFKPEIDV